MKNTIGFIDIIRSEGTFNLKFLKMLDFIVGGSWAFFLFSKKKCPLPTQDAIKSILIIRPGGMGDAIFLLPILHELRKKCPNLKIDILCEKRNRDIFSSQKNLCHNIYLYTKQKQLSQVLKNPYDVVIDTEQWHYLSSLVAYFIKAKCSIGFATRRLRKKLFTVAIEFSQDSYELENFKRLFEPISPSVTKIESIVNSFIISDELKKLSSEMIPGKAICLALGASIPLRRINKTLAIEIIKFVDSQNRHIVLLGGNDMFEIARRITKESGSKKVLNYVGQLSVLESAAIIQQSQLFIGPDSGLMHLACAVGTPVIAIFGPGNQQKWGPKGAEHSIVSEKVSCSPCTLFGYTIIRCKNFYPCLQKIEHNSILKVIHEKLIQNN